MAAAKQGKPHARQRTAEWNEKIAESNRGKKHQMTPGGKEKHAKAMGNPEVRAKLSAAAKARHAREREAKRAAYGALPEAE